MTEIEHKDHINMHFDLFVFVVFLCMKLVIAVPVIVKMQQANIDGFGMAVVVLAFINQLILHVIELVWAKIRGKELLKGAVYSKVPDGHIEHAKSTEYHVGLFDVCLGVHTMISSAMFVFACVTRRISA
jgi:hypothetical protein